MIICILSANSVSFMIHVKSVFPVYASFISEVLVFPHLTESLLLTPCSYIEIKIFPLASLVPRLIF